MRKSYGEVFDIKERLTERYLLCEGNKDRYVSSISISLVRLNDPNADHSVLEDLCICFNVKRDIQPLVEIPEEMDGVRIYKRVDDSFNALRKKDSAFSA